MDSRYFHFDLGDKENGNSIKNNIEAIYDQFNGEPVLLALDEFQHARTLDESGAEFRTNNSQIIWQLLDSGKFQIVNFAYCIQSLRQLIFKLHYLLKRGVGVEYGKVVSMTEFYIDHMDLRKEFSNLFINEF
jgi:hypothetical protein